MSTNDDKKGQQEAQQPGKDDYCTRLQQLVTVGDAYRDAAAKRNYALADAILTLFPDRVNLQPFYAGLAIAMELALQENGLKKGDREGDREGDQEGARRLFAALREYYVQKAGPCLKPEKRGDD